jgi:hypothetical protein
VHCQLSTGSPNEFPQWQQVLPGAAAQPLSASGVFRAAFESRTRPEAGCDGPDTKLQLKRGPFRACSRQAHDHDDASLSGPPGMIQPFKFNRLISTTLPGPRRATRTQSDG